MVISVALAILRGYKIVPIVPEIVLRGNYLCLGSLSQDMSKLSGRNYPGDLEPREAEEWLNVLVNEFGGEAESKEAFAQSVGHKSTNSGTFRRKVADARKYELMTPRGTFEATELGFQLANPRDQQERYEAIYEMLQNVPIIAEIHDTLNGSEAPGEFWRVLTELTDANPKEAREVSGWLGELYEELLYAEQNLESEKEQKADSQEGASTIESNEEPQSISAGGEASNSTLPDSAIFVKVGNDELRFEETTDVNIELVQRFLETKKEEGEEEGIQMRF